MAYVKQTWVDRETPLDAEHLNHMEEGISANAEAAEQNATRIGELSKEMGNVLYGETETDPKPEPEIETVAVTNLITDNPQFKDSEGNPSIEGWEWITPTVEVTTVDDDGLCLSLEGAVESKTYSLRNRFTTDEKNAFDLTHQYYLYCRMRFDGEYPSTLQPRVYLNGVSDSEISEVYPAKSGWTHASSIHVLPKIPTGSLSVCMGATYNNLTDYSVLHNTKIYYNNMMCIDLTAAFGAGNEPDIATMDAWITSQYPNGFAGTVDIITNAPEEDDGGASGGLVGRVETLERQVEALGVGELSQTGTVYPTLDAYYLTNIDEARPEYYNAQEAGTLTFTMMADVHLTPTGLQNIKNVEASSVWAKLVNNDFIMIGGDLINDYWDKPTALSMIDNVVEMAEKHAKCPVYCIKGNHDANEQHKIKVNGEDVLIKESRLTNEEFYRHANARSEKYGMVTDPAYPYNSYYYVDFPKHKIRMVCLNSTENVEGVDILTSATGDFRYSKVQSPNQMAWVENVALRVDEGWAVMMFSHIAPFEADNFAKRGADNPALRALCEAFAAGEGSFEDQKAREFIGHFCGHAHIDAYNKVGGLDYVVINSTVATKRWDISLDRTELTDKLSLNSFIIDRANHTVKCIKIGAKPGEDYGGAWVDSFRWNEAPSAT